MLTTSTHTQPQTVLETTSPTTQPSVFSQESTWTPQQLEAICRCFIRLVNAPLIEVKEKQYDNTISHKTTC